MNEPHKPSLESLLMEMIANQQSINENIEAIYQKLVEHEHRESTAARYDTLTQEDINEEELFDDAKTAVIEAGTASTSYLQRKLRIGYSRAARLMDLLEAGGVISSASGSKPREILVETIR